MYCCQVLQGADRNVDLVIMKPDGEILTSHLWTDHGDTEVTVQHTGKLSIPWTEKKIVFE